MACIDRTYVKTWEEYVEIRDWCYAQGKVVLANGSSFYPKDYLPVVCTNVEEWRENNDVELKYAPWTKEYFDECIDNIIKKYTKEYINDLEYKQAVEKTEGCVYSDEEWYQHIMSLIEMPLWNTPQYFDYYLINNCPVKFVQDRMKAVYHDNYDKMKNFKYDYSQRKRCRNFSVKRVKGRPCNSTWKFWSNYYNNRKQGKWCISISTKPSEWQGEIWRYNKEINDWVDTDNQEYAPWDETHLMLDCSFKSILRKIRKWNLKVGLYIIVEDFNTGMTKYIIKTK